MRLQISPSQLETFRKYHEEVFDGSITREDVIEAVKRRTSYKPRMGTGEAYHKVIQFGHEIYQKPEIAINHYEIPVTIWYEDEKLEVIEEFKYAELVPAINYRAKNKGLIFEVPDTWHFRSGDYDITIEMRMDGMAGNSIHENKTIYSAFWKMEQYEDSLPWQIYLVSTQASDLTFNIFEILEKKEKEPNRKVTHTEFKLYPHENMESDIKQWVELYVDFLTNNHLLNYAKRR